MPRGPQSRIALSHTSAWEPARSGSRVSADGTDVGSSLVGGDAVCALRSRQAGAAGPGQMVISDRTDVAKSDDDHLGGMHQVDEGADLDWIYGLVHPRVLEAVARQGSLNSDLRQVIALFVRATGLDEGAPDAVARHQEWIYAIHDTLRTISSGAGRFVIDDKGIVFVLVLGDSGNAHTDDMDRALSFASEIEARGAQLGLGLAAGLAAGRAFCGVIGNERRRQYVIVGPAMNTAARLMDRASHGLLAALPLPQHHLGRFRLVSAGTLDLKGVRDPVATARLEDRARVPPDPMSRELPGREQETKRLDQLLHAAQEGIGAMALIIGEPGIGKSTVAGWLVTRAADIGVRCVVGEGDLTEAASPYFAFRPSSSAQIDRRLCGAVDDVDALRQKLQRTLAALGRAAFAPIFNALLPLRLPETDTTDQLRGQRRAEVLSDLLVEVVREESQKPLAIVIEDAHWMDSASAQLVEQMHARLDRPLIVLTARPEAEYETLAVLVSRAKALRLELGPLDSDAVGSMARTLLGGAITPAVVALVEEQTRGNPFFVKEYLRELRDTARIVCEGDTWRLASVSRAPTAWSGASPTLQGLIASRIDGLPPESRLALRVASVVGQHVDLSVLARVLAQGTTEAQANVDALVEAWVRHRLVTPDRETGAPAVRFAHALIQDVAYESLMFDTRTSLHRAVAEAIEQRHTRGVGHDALLAHHWARARDAAKTVLHAEVAADEAVRAGAYREARAFAEMCVQQAAADPSVATPPRQIRWQVALADAANGLGDVRRRGAHATQALTLAGRRIPRAPWSAVVYGSTALVARAIRRRITLAPVQRDETAPIEAEYVARAYRQLAQVSFFQNDPFRYLCFAAQSMVYAERAHQTVELSGALAELGGLFGYVGLERVSAHYFAEAFELAQRSASASAAAHANMVHSLYAVGRGKWKEGITSVERCQPLCVHINDRVEWANAQVIRCWHYYYQGRIEDADAAARELESSAQECGNAQQMSWGLHSRGLCRLAAGAPGDACDLLARSVELVANGTDPTALLSTQCSLAYAYRRIGDEGVARDLATRTLNEIRAISLPMGHAMTAGLSHLADVIVTVFEQNRSSPVAAADARSAVALLRRQALVFPIAVPSYRYWQAMLERIRGGSGGRSLRIGLETARALEMPAEARRIADAFLR